MRSRQRVPMWPKSMLWHREGCRGLLLAVSIASLLVSGTMSARAADASSAFRDVRAILVDPQIRNSLSSRQSFGTSAEALSAVQEWLIWTGHYNGTIDGNLGEGTLQAIGRFQSSLGVDVTGRLSNSEVRALAERGNSQAKVMGFALHADAATGVRMGIPKAYLPSYRVNGPAVLFESADKTTLVVLQSIPSTLSPVQMRDAVIASLPAASVSYSASRRDWFVIAGKIGTRQFYFRFQKAGDNFAGFLASYEDSAAATFGSALTMMSLTLDTRTPNVFSPKVSNFQSLLGHLDRSMPPPLPAEATPLAKLDYDGEKPVSTTFRNLTFTLDSVKSPGDAASKDPVARLNFADGRSQVITIPDHGQETPASAARIFTLDKSSPFPQFVFTYFWGGAHCCTVTQIVTTGETNNLVLISPDALDGEGYRFNDIDGDGNVELIAMDNSFYYAFESYAGSIAPIKIFNLRGAVLVDVTAESFARPAIATRLKEIESADSDAKTSNGYWAGWVATKAQLGDFREAWVRMLGSYDRDTTWSMQECLQGPLNNCPNDKIRNLEFPEALAKLLVKNDYITASDSREALALWERRKTVEPPRKQSPSTAMDICSGSKSTVERIVAGQLIGRQLKPGDGLSAVSAENNFTLDGVDDKIGKTICSVTVNVDLRSMVSELASRNEMRAAGQMTQLASRRGSQLSRRVRFSVQPTSTPGQTWVTVLQ